MQATKILFVCTGNTCRSAMAAAIMNDIAKKNDLDILIESAGIFAYIGQKASDEAIQAMQEMNIDLCSHRSKPLTDELIDKADIILTMTNAHKQLIAQMAPDKVFTLGEYADGTQRDVIDPFGGDIEEYRQTATEIYDALTDIAEKLQEQSKHE